MNNIAVKTDMLKEIVKGYDKDLPITIGKEKKTVIPFSEENKDLLEFLSENIPLTNAQSNLLDKWLYGSEKTVGKLDDVTASSVNEFFRKIVFITEEEDPVLEIKIANKWYPVRATVNKFKGMSGHVVELTYYARLGALNYSRSLYIGPWDFIDNNDKPWKRTFNEVMAKRDVRAASKESVEKAKKFNAEIMAFADKTNRVYDAWGTGITYSDWFGFDDVNVGWADSPATVIIEPLLENRNAHREIDQDTEWHLPFVRAFSLKHKNYIYVDIESIKEHTYVRDGKDKIVLPKKMFTALESIFNAKRENIFGDLFHGRHGGIVVLANGPSGVGKTLTAEVFAEYQERPLYSMEMSEIGTSVKEVEANLQRIFARAKKWNAVLLFDEADIFLSEREASDLERSAIVGIFLRLLDYYEGTFFLTTNRGDGIDKAFKSRVTLYLNYPELSEETRLTIWQSMLKSAGLVIADDDPIVSWNDISKQPLNGRQIRNQVRLLKLMYPGNRIMTSDILNSLEFAAT
jgi:ATPase family associated with various cellular activities (AAA)